MRIPSFSFFGAFSFSFPYIQIFPIFPSFEVSVRSDLQGATSEEQWSNGWPEKENGKTSRLGGGGLPIMQHPLQMAFRRSSASRR
jgi:hypothetical protein